MLTDIAAALGAQAAPGTRQVTVFVPSSTRDGRSIDQLAWRDRVLTILGKMFRGATAFPPGRGVWRDDARGGALLWDDTALVVSYAATPDFERCAPDLRRFLHAMGREAEQGEIGVVVDGDYFGISVYDAAEHES